MKSVSVILQKILLLFHCHFRNYCGAISNNGGPAAFWSIFDSLNALRKIRQVNKVVDIKTYDSSSMFTNIPHAVLIRSLFSLAELCFRNAGGNKIVNIGFKKAYFADTAKSKRTFKLEEVKQLINDVVTEAYVDFAGFIFRQVKGVPMGGNASPTMADCCLAFLEYDYVMKNKNRFMGTSHCVVRYMDDICCVNFLDFEKISKDIYPSQLQLETTISCNRAIDFLDITFQFENPLKLCTKVFDKTDSFNFKVIKFTHLTTNAPENIAFGALYAQLIRFARICSEKEVFLDRAKGLIKNLEDRGFCKLKLIKTFCKFYDRNTILVFKLGLRNRRDVVAFIIQI
ncbi:MAG: hypothetical protein GY820_05880 [Gammaproteobacteria bacterium]|nr:hypothetical protein [Gammaproteobacteria bacterium]